MKKYVLLSVAALLAACSNGNDVPTSAAEAVYDCPKDKWLSNADYVDTARTKSTTNYAAYHKANGARKDVITTDSGLQYKVIQAGLEQGATTSERQKVEMHYHGFFPDGSVFDSSIDRNETITHYANGFIKGWNESLADMKVCEARVLYIPGNLAYGPNGRGQIPPNATLLFHMQLLGVKK